MSEYYLADKKAEERPLQRKLEKQREPAPAANQGMKVTLLGDFMFPSGEPKGCDPYNSAQGKSARAAGKTRGERR
jgi:hypothetical protein